MYVLKDKGVISEISCRNNFGYVLGDSKYFASTDYKVLQSESNGIFIPCMKMLYNGKIELYYMVDEYRPLSTMYDSLTSDKLVSIMVNLFGNIVQVKNNWFLQCQNIDISWDKIYIEQSTLKVKNVYLPINEKTFNSYAEFESELRSSIVKLINMTISSPNERLNKFVPALVNGSISIEDIYNRFKVAGVTAENSAKTNINQYGNEPSLLNNDFGLTLVAINAPVRFEVKLNSSHIVFGKKQELVDVVINFNNMISRKHCTITYNNGMHYIMDDGSANGTYVNGIRISSNQLIPIKKGDTIRMADSDFKLV